MDSPSTTSGRGHRWKAIHSEAVKRVDDLTLTAPSFDYLNELQLRCSPRQAPTLTQADSPLNLQPNRSELALHSP